MCKLRIRGMPLAAREPPPALENVFALGTMRCERSGDENRVHLALGSDGYEEVGKARHRYEGGSPLLADSRDRAVVVVVSVLRPAVGRSEKTHARSAVDQ